MTPNPALDLTYTVAGIRPGSTHRVGLPLVRAGGKGINVARVAHQLGYPTAVVATAGGGTGRRLAAELDAAALPYRLVPVGGETRTTITWADSQSHEATIFIEPGPGLELAEWRALADTAAAAAATAGVLVGSGSVPAGAPADFYPGLVALAHAAGIPAVIDTSGPALLAAARAGADLLKPNREELAEATGMADPGDGARHLLTLGARLVLLSDGPAGMLIVDARQPQRYLRARLAEPLAGNPTGAGDAGVAAAAVVLAAGRRDAGEILRLATAWSAAAVLAPAAGEIAGCHQELAGRLILSEDHHRP
ncbi:MAG: 1-phosphofructokinase family hexose kinase [Actinomycetales bacterium]